MACVDVNFFGFFFSDSDGVCGLKWLCRVAVAEWQ
jgi:hypothetical protein